MTDEQKALAEAYGACFGNPQMAHVVMDDVLIFARSLEGLERAGALQLYGHLQARMTMRRRDQRKPVPKTKKLEIVNA